MHIVIKQHKLSIGDQYDIFIDNKHSYTANTRPFNSWTIHLHEHGSHVPFLTIESLFALFRPSYILKMNGKEYLFRTISKRKAHYQCLIGDTLYEVFGHDGLKTSVFKNEIQIAYWEQGEVSFLEGDVYQITADDNANKKALVAFCLILDNAGSSSGGLFSLNGRIGPENRFFDESWKPRS